MSSIFVPGIPAPQGSKRHVGRGIMVESSKALKPWRSTVVATVVEAGWEPVLHGPVEVILHFTFPRPKGHYGTGRNADRLKPTAPEHHTVKPDADKLARAVLDALVQSGALRDDSQVARLRVTKGYGRPGVQIDMEALS